MKFVSINYADYTSAFRSTTQERRENKSEIDELEKRQVVLETECTRIVAYLKKTLGPIYDYEEPSKYELAIKSYKFYENDLKSKGIIRGDN